ILQNCNIYNDGAWNDLTDKETKADRQLLIEHGKPLIFGKERNRGIRMNGFRLEEVKLGEGGVTEADLLVYDETNLALAFIVGQMQPPLPVPVGVLYVNSRPTYDGAVNEQLAQASSKLGPADLNALLRRGDTWTVN
ncbi:MAG TPA: hypothetical protein VKV28_10905, partial [Candidatus Binataceae bacterium]|nr:hypothetical protein [Candidatus Binataceae bacterium]